MNKQAITNTINTGWSKKCPNLILSELRQISIKVDSFWQSNSQDNRIMLGTLNIHLN